MNPEQFLYVRYPEKQWTRFITNNITSNNQKELLDIFILMNIETYFFDNITISREPIVKTNKLDNSEISYIYYYNTSDNTSDNINIEFMYNYPSYVAYINRMVD